MLNTNQSINHVLYIRLLTVSDHLQNSMLLSRHHKTENIVVTLKCMTTPPLHTHTHIQGWRIKLCV
jgi:hypothetical protein